MAMSLNCRPINRALPDGFWTPGGGTPCDDSCEISLKKLCITKDPVFFEVYPSTMTYKLKIFEENAGKWGRCFYDFDNNVIAGWNWMWWTINCRSKKPDWLSLTHEYGIPYTYVEDDDNMEKYYKFYIFDGRWCKMYKIYLSYWNSYKRVFPAAQWEGDYPWIGVTTYQDSNTKTEAYFLKYQGGELGFVAVNTSYFEAWDTFGWTVIDTGNNPLHVTFSKSEGDDTGVLKAVFNPASEGSNCWYLENQPVVDTVDPIAEPLEHGALIFFNGWMYLDYENDFKPYRKVFSDMPIAFASLDYNRVVFILKAEDGYYMIPVDFTKNESGSIGTVSFSSEEINPQWGGSYYMQYASVNAELLDMDLESDWSPFTLQETC